MPDRKIQIQTGMMRVCYALAPLALFSIYLYGWRSFAILAVTLAVGTATEALFVFPGKKPVTSAVFVTCLILGLSLPPTIPLWMCAVGAAVGVGLGKMAFGGFGRNIFNPAMAGRCFLYVTFPIQMTNSWVEPFGGGAAGFAAWSASADALTRATPLELLRAGERLPLPDLILGTTSGSLGESSALLALLGGLYLVARKAAPWRIALSCLLGGIFTSGLLTLLGSPGVPTPLETILAGSFLFGAAFVATEPISGAKTSAGQWIYGSMIGSVIVLLRGYSNFSEGVMFAVLLMNAVVPLLDRAVGEVRKRAAAPAGEAAA